MRELLLCPPDYYGIEYEINPWMSRARGAEAALARRQWEQLHATLSKLDCKVHLIAPRQGLPDMVFTANAGLTVGRKFIPSNFRHKERAGEQPFFAEWMKQRGYEVCWLPENLYFEGEGDALFGGDVLFCGYKFRSDIQSHRAIERDIVLPEGAPQLVIRLQDRGYRCHELPMTEFIKAGGACKCLTMFMPQREGVDDADGTPGRP